MSFFTFGPNINWLSRILKINEGRFTFNYFSKHSINQRIEFKRHYTNSKQSKFHKSFILDVTNATVSILSLWNTKEIICMSPDKYVHSWLPLHGWIAERAFNTYLDRLAYEYSNIIHCLKQSIRFKLFYNYRYNEFPVLINKYVDAGLVFATSNHKGPFFVVLSVLLTKHFSCTYTIIQKCNNIKVKLISNYLQIYREVSVYLMKLDFLLNSILILI